jgi:Fur family peroxide stress response transcriptional regulator
MKRELLKEYDLKITPQRIAVLDAMNSLKDHPTAECIIEYIRKNHPNIAIGTVYKTLDTFAEKGIIKRVKTDRDVMRYDAITSNHHHLYCIETDRIKDYEDEELTQILNEYFINKRIPSFNIEEIKLQITGKFTDKP